MWRYEMDVTGPAKHAARYVASVVDTVLQSSLRGLEEVRFRVHMSPPLGFTLSQMNLLHTLLPYFLRTPFSNTPTCVWFFRLYPSGIRTKILYTSLIAHMVATCPTHLIFFELVVLIIVAEWYKV
jgi:hypothetical protein